MMKKLICLISLMIVFALSSFAQNQTPKIEEKKAKAISYGLVIDNSGSFRTNLENVIAVSKTIIGELRENDEMFLARYITSDKTELLVDLTDNKAKLESGVEEMFIEGGITEISKAIGMTADYLIKQTADKPDVLKVLIVISDGEELNSNKDRMKQELEILQKNKIKVFFLGVPSLAQKVSEKEAREFMEYYAKGTGGQMFVIDKKNDWKTSGQNLISATRPN